MNSRNLISKIELSYTKFSGVVLILLTILISSCGGWNEGNWGAAPELPVIKVGYSDKVGYTAYPTKIEGIQDIEIRAKVDGYIQAIYVDEGDFVKKGQPILKLEADVYSQNSEALQATIKSADASVNSAKIELERLKPLVDKEIISKIQLQVAEANLKSAFARLNEAKSNYNASKANQDYTLITSPVDGYIGEINYREGSLVGPGTTNYLTTISNTSKMYAYFSVSETDIIKLTKGISGRSLNDKLKFLPPLELELVDGYIYPIKGIIDASSGKVSDNTGTIRLRAIFDNPEGKLVSGNTGLLRVPSYYKNTIAIPELVTFNFQDIKMVYVLSGGDTLKMRPIQVVGKADKFLIVKSGLKPGELILAQGFGKVFPNSVIVPQEVDMNTLVNSFSPLFK